MSRPADWSPLDLSSDPIPGEPDVVLTGGNNYLDVADAISSAERKLRTIDVGDYISKAVDELAKKAEKVADDIGKAKDRYRETGLALVDYSPKLDTAQQDSLTALAAARAAAEAADTADTETKRYLKLSDEATDPTQKLHYKNLAEDDQPSKAASGKLQRAKDDLADAISLRDKAADDAADRIKDIVDHDGLNDGWWDNWGAKVLKVITDVAGWVSAIAGILALLVCWIPVVGQLLAGVLLTIAAIAAVINAVGNLVLAATGEVSWTTAIISIVGAVLSCVGAGGLARIALGSVGKAFSSASKINTIAAKELLAPGDEIQYLGKLDALKIGNRRLSESLTEFEKPLPVPKAGDTIYRSYPNGGYEFGGSWTPAKPGTFEYPASTMGLPKSNTMDNLVTAKIDNPNGWIVRHALPYGGNPGGAAEYKILNPGNPVNMGIIKVANPKLTVP